MTTNERRALMNMELLNNAGRTNEQVGAGHDLPAGTLLAMFDYKGEKRVVLPYSLKTSQKGWVFFPAQRYQRGDDVVGPELRSYRVDRIEGKVEILNLDAVMGAES